MKEQLVKWELNKSHEEVYIIEKSKFINLGLTITLISSNPKKRKIKLLFNSVVFAYRNNLTNYNEWLKACASLEKNNFCMNPNWSFFKVLNSKYIKWASEESCTVSDINELTHFMIIGKNITIEVLDISDPEISFL